MAVTTSFANSGLAEILLPQIERDTGINVQLLVVGTGQALKLGEAGDVDAVLVHARAAEDALSPPATAPTGARSCITTSSSSAPRPIPPVRPGADKAAMALAAIADAEAAFVSRGDDSGTHKAELALWKAAGITPEGDWYDPSARAWVPR